MKLNTATIFPNTLYSTTTGATATTTKHIFANGMMVATIEKVGGGTLATRYIHTDHLGGTNVATNGSGDVVQVLDYYPYGQARINNQTGGVDEKRKFASMERDASSGLDYAMARYYDNTRGQFLSQDPVFWELGQSSEGKASLLDPQLQNSYSWARNNPITQKDPDGRFVPQAVALGSLYGGAVGIAFQTYSDYQSQSFSGFGAYGAATTKGAITGAAAVVNPLLGAGAAGGTSLLGAYWSNGNITYEDAVNATAEGAVTGLTAGFVKGLPQVSGPQATKVFGGRYFSGTHGTRYAQEAGFGLGTDIYYSNTSGITSNLLTNNTQRTNSYSTGSSGGGSHGSIVGQLQSIVNSLKSLISSLSAKKK